MKRVMVMVVTLGLVLGAGVAFAGGHGCGHHGGTQAMGPCGQHGGHGPGHHRGMGAMGPCGHPGMPMMRALARLDLSESQRSRVQAIMDQVREQMEAHRRAMRSIREQLAALDPGSYDEKAVRKLASQLSEQMTEMVVLTQQTRSRIHAVLTPEQQQQLEKLRQQREARRARMWNCMGGSEAPGEAPSPPAE